MTKKIFAISTLLLVLVIGALFVYNFVFKKPAPAAQSSPQTSIKTSEEGKVTQPATATSQGGTAKPATAAQTSNLISAISDEQVFGAILSPDKNSIYYFSGANGQLNQIDLSGKLLKVLSTEKFDNIKIIMWNKPENKAIIKTETAPGIEKFLLLDVAAKQVTSLKDNIDSVAWSNQGDKIIYKYYDSKSKKRTVSIADPNGSNWRDLAQFDYQDVSLSAIPNSSLIAFWPTANAYTPTTLNTIDFSGSNKKEIMKDRYGAEFLWSPDGTRAVASLVDQEGGHKIDLYSMNGQGGQLQSLSFSTFASKCVWSNDSTNLYCAMPGNIPDTSILPNDWQDGQVTTTDTFWKIEVATGKKDNAIDPTKMSGSYDAINLFLSADEKTLFFTNKSDGKLYKLSL